jgi:hypothetical protein
VGVGFSRGGWERGEVEGETHATTEVQAVQMQSLSVSGHWESAALVEETQASITLCTVFS